MMQNDHQYSLHHRDERYYEAYLSHHTVSRRGLLRGIFGGAQASLQHAPREQHRPPFAAKEALFTEVCDGCGHCAQACPYGLIHLMNHKPVLEIDFSACDFCGRCAEVCPTQALHLAFPKDTELRPVFHSTCLLKQGQTCTECQQACPQHAILHQQNTLSLTSDCNGCGECKVRCVVGAITLQHSSMSPHL
ncbi:ferredoxin-type protein NapF [Pasteurella sp. P03HT]